MHTTIRQRRYPGRASERIPLHARLHLTTTDGKPVAPLGRCTNISLGGLRVTAAEGLPPGTGSKSSFSFRPVACFEVVEASRG